MLRTSGLGKGTCRLLVAILLLLRLVSSPGLLVATCASLWPLDLPYGRLDLRKTQCSK
jgi:hypothetical protein